MLPVSGESAQKKGNEGAQDQQLATIEDLPPELMQAVGKILNGPSQLAMRSVSTSWLDQVDELPLENVPDPLLKWTPFFINTMVATRGQIILQDPRKYTSFLKEYEMYESNEEGRPPMRVTSLCLKYWNMDSVFPEVSHLLSLFGSKLKTLTLQLPGFPHYQELSLVALGKLLEEAYVLEGLSLEEFAIEHCCRTRQHSHLPEIGTLRSLKFVCCEASWIEPVLMKYASQIRKLEISYPSVPSFGFFQTVHDYNPSSFSQVEELKLAGLRVMDAVDVLSSVFSRMEVRRVKRLSLQWEDDFAFYLTLVDAEFAPLWNLMANVSELLEELHMKMGGVLALVFCCHPGISRVFQISCAALKIVHFPASVLLFASGECLANKFATFMPNVSELVFIYWSDITSTNIQSAGKILERHSHARMRSIREVDEAALRAILTPFWQKLAHLQQISVLPLYDPNEVVLKIDRKDHLREPQLDCLLEDASHFPFFVKTEK